MRCNCVVLSKSWRFDGVPYPDTYMLHAHIQGSGKATTYWDCCKTTCAWRGNAGDVTAPVRTCTADGIGTANENTQGGCANGVARNAGSYVCNDQVPFAVGGKQYAFAAANVGTWALTATGRVSFLIIGGVRRWEHGKYYFLGSQGRSSKCVAKV